MMVLMMMMMSIMMMMMMTMMMMMHAGDQDKWAEVGNRAPVVVLHNIVNIVNYNMHCNMQCILRCIEFYNYHAFSCIT